jgi:Zn-dependent M28 family amino/carboxypeptidase
MPLFVKAPEHTRAGTNRWTCLVVLTVTLTTQFGCESPDARSGDAVAVADAMSAITPESIRAPMRFLAHDLLEGRDTGSRGYDIAAHYVASELESMGLEPLGDAGGFFQQVPLRKALLDVEQSSIVVTRDGAPHALELGADVVLRPPFNETQTRIEAPLVFAGHGISAPELDYDDYAELDATGAVVLVLSGAPARFGSTERAYFSSNDTKAQQALAKGALGVLVVLTPTDEARRPFASMQSSMSRPSMQWIDPETNNVSSAGSQLALSGVVSRAAAQALLEGSAHSIDDIFASLDSDSGELPRFALSATVTAQSVGTHEDFESPNIVARLTGVNRADEAVVITAHLDHVGRGRSVDGDDLYNGAYDNASGVAVLIAVARAFADTASPPDRSIIFLALTAEEKGLLGSDYFAHHPTLPAESIVANVNADGALMFHPLHDIVAFGADHSTILEPVSRAASDLGIDLSPDFMPEQVIFIRSDQYSFVRAGIPAVYPFVGNETGNDRVDGRKVLDEWMTTRYHKPSDDMEQEMDFEAGADYAKLTYLIGHYIAAAENRPAWNEGDFLGEKFAR